MLWFGFRVHSNEIDVIDGDSINWRRGGWGCDGQETEGTIKYRLAGYDSPELGERAKSSREANWAEDAKAYLKQRIEGARTLRIRPVMFGRRRTPHGDRLAVLFIDGQNVKDLMVQADMGAVPEWKDGRMQRPAWAEMER